jgi:hypothetical protein
MPPPSPLASIISNASRMLSTNLTRLSCIGGHSSTVSGTVDKRWHGSGITVPYSCLQFGKLCIDPTPSDFSLRWSAERSMPMKAAVRLMLPPKRLICAIR